MELQEQGPGPCWLMLFHAALLTGAGQNKPACSHPLGENWASLRPNITIKYQITLPEEQIYDLIILWLDKHIFHHVYLYRKRNLSLFLQPSALSDAQGSGGVTSTRGIEEMCGCDT